MSGSVNAWLSALVDRHARSYTTTELAKAIRALSARYVERRHELHSRSATDSAGKRAAFAVFFAPLHFLTVARVIGATSLDSARVSDILDLGCGSGCASAAWALSGGDARRVVGIDRDAWAVREAEWTWRTLGVRGRARRGDLVAAAEGVGGSRAHLPEARQDTGILLGWAANELTDEARGRLLRALSARVRAGATVCVIEPVARRAAPWWNEWRVAFGEAARADEWTFDVLLPDALAQLADAAGLHAARLTARSLIVTPR